MIETYSRVQNSQLGGQSSRKNNLMGKVVLLMGNDAEILQPLAVKLAANGGDIALASSQLSVDSADIIRERVEAFGGRFLYVDINDIQESEAIIRNITEALGGMDIVVDMSAYKGKRSARTIYQDTPQPQRWLSRAIFEEI